MKNITLIYCGEDGDAGKAVAQTIRAKDPDNVVLLTSSEFFSGAEPVDHVIIMPDVPAHKAVALREAYPNMVEAAVQPSSYQEQGYVLGADGYELRGRATEPKRGPGRPRKVAA